MSNQLHRRKKLKNKRKKLEQNDDYFCDAPNKEYTHMVLVRSNGNASLLDIESVRGMCDLETKLTTLKNYKGLCQLKFYSKQCCRPWSIPNYITLLSNKTTCAEIEVRFKIE